MDNTSGQGKGAVVPPEVMGLAWGAFFWNWIWGLFNRVWIALLMFVPVVGWVVAFVLLFKGREWAWRSKRWESVEHFNRVQRNWAIAALLIFGGIFLLGIAAAILVPMLADKEPPAAEKPAPPKAMAQAPAAKREPPPVAVVPKAAEPAPKAGVEPPAAKAAPAPVPVPAAAKPRPSAPPQAAAPATKPGVDPSEARRALAPAVAPAAPQPVVMIPGPKFNDVMTAVLYRDQAAVTQLLDLGRWVDRRDSNGRTPLIAAAALRDAAMVELLIKRGANPNLSVPGGETALSVARSNGDASTIGVLQRHGAK